jgi:glutaminyl-peptide cyclotransferase
MLVLLCAACDGTAPTQVELVATLPHDPNAVTEGLVFAGGTLFESTGGFGDSTLREVDLDSGAVTRVTSLNGSLFAEGLALVGSRFIQLTWKNEIAFVYDTGLTPIGELSYDGEGWGLCYDGTQLWMSNGTNILQRRHPGTFALTGTVAVQTDHALNELECVGEHIYANAWLTSRILKIKRSGGVAAVIDTRDILPITDEQASAQNGIAFDPNRGLFYLTGKLWPHVFAVHLGD